MQTIRSDDIALVFIDHKRLVLLGTAGYELAREEIDEKPEKVENAFRKHNYEWAADGDPFKDQFRRWIPDAPELSPGAHALLKARHKALKDEETDDVEEFRLERTVGHRCSRRRHTPVLAKSRNLSSEHSASRWIVTTEAQERASSRLLHNKPHSGAVRITTHLIPYPRAGPTIIRRRHISDVSSCAAFLANRHWPLIPVIARLRRNSF